MTWPLVKLGDICRPRQHKTIPSSELHETGYVVYGANGPIGYYSDFTHDRTTIAVTCRGATCGTINIVPPMSYITGNAMALDELDDTRVDLRFLAHALEKIGFASVINGAAQPQITRAPLLTYEIPLPPLEEQKRIAAILDQADALRRLRVRALDRLNALGQAIFHEMFGDPKIELDRWPTLGFDDACKDETAKSPKVQKGDYSDIGDVPVIDQGQKKIAGFTNIENACVTSGPVIIFGDHTRAVKFIDFRFAIGADGAKVLRASDQYVPIFFATLLHNLPIPDLGYSRHMREVKKLRFPAPPLADQMIYASRIENLIAQREAFKKSDADMSALFKSLQHRAFRGEL